MQDVNSAEMDSWIYKNNAKVWNEVNFQYVVEPNKQHLRRFKKGDLEGECSAISIIKNGIEYQALKQDS